MLAPKLKEIYILVHPFFEVWRNPFNKNSERKRVEQEFLKTYLSRWGKLVNEIAEKEDSILLIDFVPQIMENKRFLELGNRFQRFAESRLGKNRVFAFPVGADYENVCFEISKHFVPEKKVTVYSFGEWREMCVDAVGFDFAEKFKSYFRLHRKQKCPLRVITKLSVPRNSLPPALNDFRRVQRYERKKLRKIKTMARRIKARAK